MCLLVFSYRQHPVYDLIFAANRDEFYERPTKEAAFWEEYPKILAGKDMKAGGTWMGITKSGDFSALTNYRDPSTQKDNPPSRGHLVLDFLTNNSSPEEYLRAVDQKSEQYNGFNLLAGDLNRLMYYSNQERKLHDLVPGLYGLSNKLLDTPWPKVQKAKADLQTIIQSEEIPEEALFELLRHDQPAPDDQLPDTGIPRELERAVSPIFIKTDQYGTRNSTVVLADKSGKVTFEERRFKNGSQKLEEVNRYEFEIN